MGKNVAVTTTERLKLPTILTNTSFQVLKMCSVCLFRAAFFNLVIY